MEVILGQKCQKISKYAFLGGRWEFFIKISVEKLTENAIFDEGIGYFASLSKFIEFYRIVGENFGKNLENFSYVHVHVVIASFLKSIEKSIETFRSMENWGSHKSLTFLVKNFSMWALSASTWLSKLQTSAPFHSEKNQK